ncbi:MAG: hypothetical protein CMJ27_02455, partial [Phycisphaerae bacterium]|nr:hypothetical protein [Phycisphaerae bacterium]
MTSCDARATVFAMNTLIRSITLALACTLMLPAEANQDAGEPVSRGPEIRFGRPTPLAKTDGAIRCWANDMSRTKESAAASAASTR